MASALLNVGWELKVPRGKLFMELKSMSSLLLASLLVAACGRGGMSFQGKPGSTAAMQPQRQEQNIDGVSDFGDKVKDFFSGEDSEEDQKPTAKPAVKKKPVKLTEAEQKKALEAEQARKAALVEAKAKADEAKRTAAAESSVNKIPPDSQDEVKGVWESNRSDGKTWTIYAIRALEKYGEPMLEANPGDAKTFCPNFDRLDRAGRMNFYVNFIAAISYEESSWNPKDLYTEKFNNSKGEKVVSRGLMALSKESAGLYHCDINEENDLYDPRLNLECSVRIISRWITKDQYIAYNVGEHDEAKNWRGAARYFHTLWRDQAKKRNEIIRKTSHLKVCKTE